MPAMTPGTSARGSQVDQHEKHDGDSENLLHQRDAEKPPAHAQHRRAREDHACQVQDRERRRDAMEPGAIRAEKLQHLPDAPDAAAQFLQRPQMEGDRIPGVAAQRAQQPLGGPKGVPRPARTRLVRLLWPDRSQRLGGAQRERQPGGDQDRSADPASPGKKRPFPVAPGAAEPTPLVPALRLRSP